MKWSAFVEAALYGPDGFYTRSPGGRRHYMTSSTIGPLFGAVVSRAIEACWDGCGRPADFVVVDAGAGDGSLGRAVTLPPTVRWVDVEVGAPMPPGPFDGLIIANELLDNLPFDVFERTPDGWASVELTHAAGIFEERLVPGGPAALEVLAPGAPVGARVPWQAAAGQWWRDAVASVRRGAVVAFDYGRTTAEMAREGGWLRTYRHGGPGGSPLVRVGEQDITTDVATDQLLLVDPGIELTTQAAWLTRHGIGDLVAEARRAWESRAAIGDLAALRSRSRIGEGAALVDPSGLGAFIVAERRLPD